MIGEERGERGGEGKKGEGRGGRKHEVDGSWPLAREHWLACVCSEEAMEAPSKTCRAPTEMPPNSQQPSCMFLQGNQEIYLRRQLACFGDTKTEVQPTQQGCLISASAPVIWRLCGYQPLPHGSQNSHPSSDKGHSIFSRPIL